MSKKITWMTAEDLKQYGVEDWEINDQVRAGKLPVFPKSDDKRPLEPAWFELNMGVVESNREAQKARLRNSNSRFSHLMGGVTVRHISECRFKQSDLKKCFRDRFEKPVQAQGLTQAQLKDDPLVVVALVVASELMKWGVKEKSVITKDRFMNSFDKIIKAKKLPGNSKNLGELIWAIWRKHFPELRTNEKGGVPVGTKAKGKVEA